MVKILVSLLIIATILAFVLPRLAYRDYIKSVYKYQGKWCCCPVTPDYPYDKVCKLDWDTIKSIYQVCPERWKWIDDGGRGPMLYYNANRKDRRRVQYVQGFKPAKEVWEKETTICVIIPYKEWRHMNTYIKEYNAKVTKEEEMEATQKLIESAQADIDSLKLVASLQIEEAKEEIDRIVW